MVQKRIYADSNLLIIAFESSDGEALADRLFDPGRGFDLVTSEVTIGEVLVGPMRTSDVELMAAYQDLLANPDILQVLPIRRETLLEAARLRALSSMKLPDAIHVATAVLAKCEALLSFDKRLTLPEPIVRLDPTPSIFDAWIDRR